MAAPQRCWAAELLHFWFHRLGPQDWFGGSERVDEALEQRFARELGSLWARPAEEFLSDPQTALAAVLLFDQLPRNLHRGTPRAFAFDPLARTIAREALSRGWDARLPRQQRQFLAMPLMHSEHISDQLDCLRIYARLGRRYGWPFARSHSAMVARFGRFPHRNEVLGRRSSPAEQRAVEAGNSW